MHEHRDQGAHAEVDASFEKLVAELRGRRDAERKED
jgi:hypothetical protein